MTQTIKKTLLSLGIAAVMLFPAFLLSVGATAQTTYVDYLCQGGTKLSLPVGNTPPAGCHAIGDEDTNSLNDLIATIINVLSVLVGVLAVVMIIIGGFRYVTSGGNSEKVTGAKNTILYALIGLVIVALAQAIVRFVLKNVT